MSQVTEDTINRKHVTITNKTIRNMASTKQRGLCSHTLELKTWRTIAIGYALLPNYQDLSSQLGRFILLTNDRNRATTVSDSSYKSKRDFPAVLGAEAFSLVDWFNSAFTLRDNVQRIFRNAIPLAVLANSACLCNVMTNYLRNLKVDQWPIKHIHKKPTVKRTSTMSDGFRQKKYFWGTQKHKII